MGNTEGDPTTLLVTLAVGKILQSLEEEVEDDTVMIGGISDDAEGVEESTIDEEPH